MQSIRPAEGPISTIIKIPGSKFITENALLIATLANGVSELSGIRINHATKVFISALQQLGIIIQLDENAHSCIVAGCNGRFPQTQATFWCDKSKSIARYLITACANSPGVFYFDGSVQLRGLNIFDQLNILSRQGAQIIPGDASSVPFTLIGADSLDGGEIFFEAKINSHFASALLIMAPFARRSVSFNNVDMSIQPYLDTSSAIMAEFGVLVHRLHQGHFIIPVPQRYQPRDYVIEPDLKLATYFFAAAALTGGQITIQHINRSLAKQPEIKFLSILEKMGCEITESANGLTLKAPPQLKGIETTIDGFANFFGILAILAIFANTPTKISNIGLLSLKEINQIALIKNELLKRNISIEINKDWIQIHPGKFQGSLINSHHNVEIAMIFALAGLKIPGMQIENPECVTKIYPEFFSILDNIAENEPVCL